MALAAASKDTWASLAGPPTSAPVPTQVSASEVTLRWGPPMSTGGFAIRGYVVEKREALEYDVTEPGEYELTGDGKELRKLCRQDESLREWLDSLPTVKEYNATLQQRLDELQDDMVEFNADADETIRQAMGKVIAGKVRAARVVVVGFIGRGSLVLSPPCCALPCVHV